MSNVFDTTRCALPAQPSIVGENLLADCALPGAVSPIAQCPPVIPPAILALPTALLAWSGAGIGARTGTTPSDTVPGHATVTAYSFPSLVKKGTLTAYNMGTGTHGPVGANKWIVVILVDQGWMVVWEECAT